MGRVAVDVDLRIRTISFSYVSHSCTVVLVRSEFEGHICHHIYSRISRPAYKPSIYGTDYQTISN